MQGERLPDYGNLKEALGTGWYVICECVGFTGVKSSFSHPMYLTEIKRGGGELPLIENIKASIINNQNTIKNY